ncbi:MAG TPA: ATP-binding protein [Pyrinomonadaceae bacterium]|jgi:two-component system sensor histidine kinase KdpD|nr:ATP-binding protein [Pyrinomonadaceae bacterium]
MNTDYTERWIGYVVAVLSVGALTLFLKIVGAHVNAATVSLALLLNVLFIATRWGSLPALLASIVAMLCFNFFFLPPFGTFTIAATDNWIALLAFLVTAVTAGQLSGRARKRAEEAESGRREIERLYAELRDAFERASHAEALRQSEKLKSALLDAVTHDLRTPLTSIKASITTLLDEVRGRTNDEPPVALDAESRVEMMEVIDEESDRLSRFINGLIELARIEAGELHLRRRWGAVDEIISAALVRAEPITRGHRVELDVEKELPGVRVDERAVSEVVYALIDNAAKYSAKGSAIRISARRAGDELIQMAVEDEGPGIPANLRERVFDKFFRATRDGDVRNHQPTGTGMGLAIAKGIVEAHEGTISIESGNGGKGTRVVFTLPTGDDEVVEEAQRAAATVETR